MNDILTSTPGIIAGSFALAACSTVFLTKKFRTVLIVPETQDTLLLRYGKFVRLLTSGKHTLWGRVYEIVRYDTRQHALTLQGQEILTADGISVKTTVVGTYRVVDAQKRYTASSDPVNAVYTAIQLALREFVGNIDLETLLQEKGASAEQILPKVADVAKEVGLEVTSIALRDLILPGEVKRSFSESFRVKKESLAKLESARGQAAALRILANAARSFEKNPALIQLRYLETIEKTAESAGNTFVVGLPDGVTVSTPPNLF